CAVAEKLQLNHPWLIAVWPGMGHVALNAGVYLLAKLGMTVVAEYEAADLFDVDQVEVKHGIIQPGRRARNRFFVWTDPNKMPHVFAQLPFPKASLAILEVFATIAGIDLDLTELAEQAESVEQQLGDLLARVEERYGPQAGEGEEDEEDEEGFRPEPAEEERV